MQEAIKVNVKNFDPKHIFECGQVFRYDCREDGYRILASDRAAVVRNGGEEYIIESNDSDYFRNYFDLETEYAGIVTALAGNSLVHRAAQYGSGIRILRQDKCETLISFLISQNNHIPRIKSIIERLCETLGERKEFRGESYFAFPTVQKLAAQNESYFTQQGLGYRAQYIARVVRALADGFDLEEIASLSTYAARKKLLSIFGIGPKVADCILLFAYHRMDVFPVDTWMEKVYYDYFSQKKASIKQITDYFVNKFGGLSGYAQQYLFYYKREINKN